MNSERTPSIKRPRKGLRAQCKPWRAAKVLPRRAHTAVLPRVKPQVATSMRQQTAMYARTPGAVGIRHRGPLTRDLLQATQEPTLLLRAAMEGRKRAAGHRCLAAEAEVVGNPDRRALVVRRAAVAVVAGEANGVDPDEVNLETGVGREFYERSSIPIPAGLP